VTDSTPTTAAGVAAEGPRDPLLSDAPKRVLTLTIDGRTTEDVIDRIHDLLSEMAVGRCVDGRAIGAGTRSGYILEWSDRD
jgi:hypothetical protein